MRNIAPHGQPPKMHDNNDTRIMKLKQNHRKISHRILKVSEIAFMLFPFQLFGLCRGAVEDALQMLRDLSVLPGFGGANFVRAGVAEVFDKGIHLVIVTKLYKEFQDVLRSQRPYRPRRIRLRGARRHGDCRTRERPHSGY